MSDIIQVDVLVADKRIAHDGVLHARGEQVAMRLRTGVHHYRQGSVAGADEASTLMLELGALLIEAIPRAGAQAPPRAEQSLGMGRVETAPDPLISETPTDSPDDRHA